MISLRDFDRIRRGDVVTREGEEFTVEQVCKGYVDGGRVVDTVVFCDGTCVTREDGFWLLRAYHYPMDRDGD